MVRFNWSTDNLTQTVSNPQILAQLFSQIDEDGRGVLNGGAILDFCAKSGVPDEALQQIWDRATQQSPIKDMDMTAFSAFMGGILNFRARSAPQGPPPPPAPAPAPAFDDFGFGGAPQPAAAAPAGRSPFGDDLGFGSPAPAPAASGGFGGDNFGFGGGPPQQQRAAPPPAAAAGGFGASDFSIGAPPPAPAPAPAPSTAPGMRPMGMKAAAAAKQAFDFGGLGSSQDPGALRRSNTLSSAPAPKALAGPIDLDSLLQTAPPPPPPAQPLSAFINAPPPQTHDYTAAYTGGSQANNWGQRPPNHTSMPSFDSGFGGAAPPGAAPANDFGFGASAFGAAQPPPPPPQPPLAAGQDYGMAPRQPDPWGNTLAPSPLAPPAPTQAADTAAWKPIKATEKAKVLQAFERYAAVGGASQSDVAALSSRAGLTPEEQGLLWATCLPLSSLQHRLLLDRDAFTLFMVSVKAVKLGARAGGRVDRAEMLRIVTPAEDPAAAALRRSQTTTNATGGAGAGGGFFQPQAAAAPPPAAPAPQQQFGGGDPFGFGGPAAAPKPAAPQPAPATFGNFGGGFGGQAPAPAPAAASPFGDNFGFGGPPKPAPPQPPSRPAQPAASPFGDDFGFGGAPAPAPAARPAPSNASPFGDDFGFGSGPSPNASGAFTTTTTAPSGGFDDDFGSGNFGGGAGGAGHAQPSPSPETLKRRDIAVGKAPAAHPPPNAPRFDDFSDDEFAPPQPQPPKIMSPGKGETSFAGHPTFQALLNMGFPPALAQAATDRHGNDMDSAATFCLENGDKFASQPPSRQQPPPPQQFNRQQSAGFGAPPPQPQSGRQGTAGGPGPAASQPPPQQGRPGQPGQSGTSAIPFASAPGPSAPGAPVGPSANGPPLYVYVEKFSVEPGRNKVMDHPYVVVTLSDSSTGGKIESYTTQPCMTPQGQDKFFLLQQKLDFTKSPKDLPPSTMLIIEVKHKKPKGKEPSVRAWTCVPLHRLFPHGLGQQANIDLPLLHKPTSFRGDTSSGMLIPTKVYQNRIWVKVGAPAK